MSARKLTRPSTAALLTGAAGVAAAGGVIALAIRHRARRPATDDGARRRADQEWHCACGQAYRVNGEGRHRVYWLPDADPADPVLGGHCARCERPLPGRELVEAA